LLLRPLPLSHDADTVVETLTDMIAGLPQDLRRTLTWDQGAEIAKTKELTKKTTINVYFADPHSPWQRGSNKNTSGDPAKRQKLAPTKMGIQNFLTNSLVEIRPMSIDRLQSLRSKYNTIDEWLSGDVRENVIGAIEQGSSKHEEYSIIAISS